MPSALQSFTIVRWRSRNPGVRREQLALSQRIAEDQARQIEAFAAIADLRNHHQRSRAWGHTNYSWELLRVTVGVNAGSNVGIPQDMRQAANRRAFPTLSRRINVLTPISRPYMS